MPLCSTFVLRLFTTYRLLGHQTTVSVRMDNRCYKTAMLLCTHHLVVSFGVEYKTKLYTVYFLYVLVQNERVLKTIFTCNISRFLSLPNRNDGYVVGKKKRNTSKNVRKVSTITFKICMFNY